jgi:hypothetical protein
MKYVEELSSGDCFEYDSKKFLLTADFRKNGSRLAYSLTDGLSSWISSQSIVEILPIYYLDKENNIIPIKITKKENVTG